ELIEQLSEYELIDNTIQLFELYEVYAKNNKNPEPFDEFTKWGQIVLHDFNEIDRYLVPTDQLFKHVNEARAIEVWNVDGQEITEFQQKYLDFWKQLGEIYQKYTSHLTAKGLAYEGLAYRKVSEEITANPEEFISNKIDSKHLVFAGFNAFNKAEEKIIEVLKKQNKCSVIFDADTYYLEDQDQESGLFLRKWKEREYFKPFGVVNDKFKTSSKQIDIFGIPQNVGQAKYLSTVLANINSAEYTDTAVVLADENLLVPVLQSIPESIENINVTMGYPLKNTPLNNFFEIYLATYINAERYGHKGNLTYHYKDLLKLFQLPFSQIVFGVDNCQKIKEHIIKHNWVFINKDNLAWINKQLTLPFAEKIDIAQLLKQCVHFIEIGKQYYKNQNKENVYLELEYLFQFAKLFQQIISLTSQYPFIENPKGFYSLYRQILSSHTIELYGEPLRGLQVLGMLETRNIDFKNVILLSANEGTLPAGKSFNSFIPFDIKRYSEYGLPTHIEKDAVYAYHFYRLIQNADNITILYNTQTDEFGSGEQSRFVTQIENELPLYNSEIKINKQLVVYPTKDDLLEVIDVKKTPDIIAKIKERFKDGFSPSALSSYIECPLNFYYNYVIGVKDADEVEEEIEMSSFGTFVHDALEELYQPFIEKYVTSKDLKHLLKLADETVVKVFTKNKFTLNELKRGKNLLTLNVAQNYVKTFINNELDLVKDKTDLLYIKSLEEELYATIKVGEEVIKLKGKADRIDKFDNVLRIIDYKTGVVEAKNLKVTDIELLSESKRSKAFQVLMYALMYNKQHNLSNVSLHSGIISFRKLSEGFMPFGIGGSRQTPDNEITQEILNDFEKIVVQIIEQIFNEEIPFVHNHDAQWCEFCD
ncbi:MAG: PD-(D/E)XK nuclease family protein, partial [Vicingaceae bacterium]|nr:PD-(D/E)XK nuclease family protein [Vicingaceae bacterium]